MKILWVNTNFLHPTTKGGQIRTLEMLRHLHSRHEIHYVAIADPAHSEGPRRATEYSAQSYPFLHRVPSKSSPAFVVQLARGLFSSVPVAVSRFHPPKMRDLLEALIRRERFDRAVVDHLAPTAYFPGLERAVLFQHNVETVIWQRRAEYAADPLRRFYFRTQAGRMYRYEGRVCRAAGHVVAVSGEDAARLRELFDVTRISVIPTGVNLEYFTPQEPAPSTTDLVFIGSMDWRPNVDGILYFVREVLPLIRRRRPECTLAIVGRTPPPEITKLSRESANIIVTGTVPDVRPHLWRSRLSVVPLRIGGGTRLKIYESMAAGIPVVATSIAAEGLTIDPPENIRIADSPAAFADSCVDLLSRPEARSCMAAAAWDMVSSRFSWETVSRRFEQILEGLPSFAGGL